MPGIEPGLSVCSSTVLRSLPQIRVDIYLAFLPSAPHGHSHDQWGYYATLVLHSCQQANHRVTLNCVRMVPRVSVILTTALQGRARLGFIMLCPQRYLRISRDLNFERPVQVPSQTRLSMQAFGKILHISWLVHEEVSRYHFAKQA